MNLSGKKFLLTTMGALFFAACGDSSTETIVEKGAADIVDEVADLPKCDKSHEGEQIFVKDDAAMRICSDGKWYATMGSAGAGAADTIFVSKNDTVYVSSIDTVLVAGRDTVYVSGGDTIRISVTNTDTIYVVNKDTVYLSVGDGVGGGNIVLDSEQVAVSLDSVKGASQKGPFLSGSKVLVKELRDGRSLTQTGNNFDGKILNDKGEFRITARMLVSQYVMLEANGYYRNEVTGQNSSSPLTLFGITDVTGRDIVNINLLTHLEYERVYYLVTKEGYTVKKAKKKAQQEIFDILHIDNSNFSNSEDLSIAGSSDEDGALLAFSILFQGDRSVSQLTELLTRVSTAMEKEGKWEDATAKAEIADWAMVADTSDRLADIRGGVEAWKLGSMVPKFEPYIRNFWRVEHGLGLCGDSVKVGTVVKPTRGRTEANIRFICAEKSASGTAFADGEPRWRIATDFEKDSYGWKDSTDGALKDGSVTGKKYVYDATGAKNGAKGWREAENAEILYGGCVEAWYDSIKTYRGHDNAGFYKCDKATHLWNLEWNTLTIDTQKWKPGDDGFSKWGDSIGVIDPIDGFTSWTRICYVYDKSINAYRKGLDIDCSLNLQGCTIGRAGTFLPANNGKFYSCTGEIWDEITDPVLRNTRDLECNSSDEELDGKIIHGTIDDLYFVCENSEWRLSTPSEEIAYKNENIRKACMETNQGIFYAPNNKVLACNEKNWYITTLPLSVMEETCGSSDIGKAFVDADTLDNGVTVSWICGNRGWFRAAEWYEYTYDVWVEHLKNIWPMDNPNYGHMTDERDGHVYRTVKIGDQIWMAENLQYSDSVKYVNLKGNSWCYDKGPDPCKTGGRYYTWSAAMNFNERWNSNEASALIQNPHQGICPDGWHIPSKDDWNAFKDKAGNYATQQLIGFAMWPRATNTSGFSALPAGYYYPSFRKVADVGAYAIFWSATEYHASRVYRRYLHSINVELNIYDKDLGHNIRCLCDSSDESVCNNASSVEK